MGVGLEGLHALALEHRPIAVVHFQIERVGRDDPEEATVAV
jgi:hypothetical protein